jgi:hypothetical protein
LVLWLFWQRKHRQVFLLKRWKKEKRKIKNKIGQCTAFGGPLEEVALGDSIGRGWSLKSIVPLEVAGDWAITTIKKINGVRSIIHRGV